MDRPEQKKVYRFSLYMHIAPNGKRYVGITSESNPKERWGKDGCNYIGSRFAEAIQEFGWDNIQHCILFSGLTRKEAAQKEIEFIAKYDTTNPDYGYNISPGGNYAADSTKEKMAAARKAMRGEAHPCNKTVLKIDRNTGEVLCSYPSAEIAAKDIGTYGTTISKCAKSGQGQVGGFLWCYQKDYTQDFFEKYRGANWKFDGRRWYDVNRAHQKRSNEVKARMKNSHGKKVVCLETGEVFPTGTEAARKYGISVSGILKCCAGKISSYRGMHWQYAENGGL